MTFEIPPLVASTETLKEIADLSSFNLRIPAVADTKGARKAADGTLNPRFVATWTEPMEVTDSRIVPTSSQNETVKGCVEVRVRLRCSEESAENGGRPFSFRVFIAPEELKPKGEKSPRRTMTLMACGTLNGLLRAAGYADIGGTDVDYREYFQPPSGSPPPVIGAKVLTVVKHYLDGGREFQDVQEFKGRQ